MVNPEWSRVYIFRPILPRDVVVVKGSLAISQRGLTQSV